jgi:uncharacterized membrane protein YccC
MDNDPHETKFNRIEAKLRILVILSIVQTIVIALLVACLFIKQFMPSTLTLMLLVAGVGVFVYLFRSQIPAWFGGASRFFFAQLFAAQKSESFKASSTNDVK